jgi:hypothetical protein
MKQLGKNAEIKIKFTSTHVVVTIPLDRSISTIFLVRMISGEVKMMEINKINRDSR